jgi:hypothetical protein
MVVKRIKKDGVMTYVCLAISTLRHLQQLLPSGDDNGKLLFLAALLEFRVLVSI